MNIVFLIGCYYPYYSAVGKCAGNVADELSKSHNVTVICEKSYETQADKEIFNNQKIIRFMTKDMRIRDKLSGNIRNSRGLLKKFHVLVLNMYKILQVIKVIFSRVTIKKDLVNQFLEALNGIDDNIDLIIPTCMPFESVLAALEYKSKTNNKTRVIPYLFDQFADNANLHRLNINKAIKRPGHILLEKQMIMESNSVLAMHSLREHFESEFSEYNNKIYYMEHPLLIKQTKLDFEKSQTNIVITYVGALLKNYVTPDYLLELFSKANLEESVLNFYIVGNCNSIVDKYSRLFPTKIINNGSVERSLVDSIIKQSDILISIAEKDGIQMSSKIFDYMSCGKPIVHFYSVDNDVNLKILKKYPLSLCLKQDIKKFHENIKLFNDFCRKNRNSCIIFEEVESIFPDATPKNTADFIIKHVTE